MFRDVMLSGELFLVRFIDAAQTGLIDREKILELLEFSNLRKPPKLPDLVDLDAQWTCDDGMRVDTRKLLFGDLSRLFANQIYRLANVAIKQHQLSVCDTAQDDGLCRPALRRHASTRAMRLSLRLLPLKDRWTDCEQSAPSRVASVLHGADGSGRNPL